MTTKGWLSERTRAEMFRGGKSVGCSSANTIASVFEGKWKSLYPDAEIKVEPVLEDERYHLALTMVTVRKEALAFPMEPLETYPSDKLLTQMIVLFG